MKAMFNWISNLFKHQVHTQSCKHDFAPWRISTCQNTTSGAILLVQVRVCRKCMYSQIDRQEM